MRHAHHSDLWPGSWPDGWPGPSAALALMLTVAIAAAVHVPDRETRRWLLRQQFQHRDRLPWRRWRLAATLLSRGVHLRQPLEGNVLQLLNSGRIAFGPRVVIESGVRIWGGPDATISLGAGVELRRNVGIGAISRVEIGDHTLIAQGCYITDANHVYDDPTVPLAAQGMRVKGPTVIEDNVWVGANAVITSGVRIGRGSVIGANTVVTHDVPPYSIVHGSAGAVHARTAPTTPISPYLPPNEAKRAGSAERGANASADSAGTVALPPGVTS